MKSLVKTYVKYFIFAGFLGILQLMNSTFIEGEIYTMVLGVRLSDLIAAALLLIFTLFTVRLGKQSFEELKENPLISRLIRISIWLIAFIIIFNNDNFSYAITQSVRQLFLGFNLYPTMSDLTTYLVLIEITLIAIPLIRFFIFFFNNLDDYLDILLQRTPKGKKALSSEVETTEEVTPSTEKDNSISE